MRPIQGARHARVHDWLDLGPRSLLAILTVEEPTKESRAKRWRNI
jgi:hypothetical protein